MLKTIRVTLAIVMLLIVTFLFVDFTGLAPTFGWAVKIQLIPALLSLNLVIVACLVALTLIFGRIYCSVICPLGVSQDFMTWLRGKVGERKSRKNRFHWIPAKSALRWSIFGLFVALMAFGTVHASLRAVASLIEPYSAWGRIASVTVRPLYHLVNNEMLAYEAERQGSTLFYQVDSAPMSVIVISVAVITLLVVGLTAFLHGRAYCNDICPVGTLLGWISRFSLLRPVINLDKCNGCRKCERNCKASCINAKEHVIDMSRCVACMDCIGNCSTGAISYGIRKRQETVKPKDPSPIKPLEEGEPDPTRRAFMLTAAIAAGAAVATAKEKLTDGGLADIVEKTPRKRVVPVVPPGAKSVKNFTTHCTACQLCISECPNQVLRPSTSLDNFMQPVMQFDKGYCRPECDRCSSVCPVGAILPLEDTSMRSAISVGHAVVDREVCLEANGTSKCGNCARRCPSQAIVMVEDKTSTEESPRRFPAVNEAACIGCGACEHLCPVSPVSAIHVEGREVHVII